MSRYIYSCVEIRIRCCQALLSIQPMATKVTYASWAIIHWKAWIRFRSISLFIDGKCKAISRVLGCSYSARCRKRQSRKLKVPNHDQSQFIGTVIYSQSKSISVQNKILRLIMVYVYVIKITVRNTICVWIFWMLTIKCCWVLRMRWKWYKIWYTLCFGKLTIQVEVKRKGSRRAIQFSAWYQVLPWKSIYQFRGTNMCYLHLDWTWLKTVA